jgi:hypothetical protein
MTKIKTNPIKSLIVVLYVSKVNVFIVAKMIATIERPTIA